METIDAEFSTYQQTRLFLKSLFKSGYGKISFTDAFNPNGEGKSVTSITFIWPFNEDGKKHVKQLEFAKGAERISFDDVKDKNGFAVQIYNFSYGGDGSVQVIKEPITQMSNEQAQTF